MQNYEVELKEAASLPSFYADSFLSAYGPIAQHFRPVAIDYPRPPTVKS